MDNIDVKSLIEKSGLDPVVLAKELYPSNKFPVHALQRVIAGEALLNSEQIAKLAQMLNVEINEVYDISKWKVGANKDLIYLKHGEYRVELDLTAKTSKIFSGTTLKFETVLHSSTIALSEYIAEINKIITKIESNGTN